MACTLCGDMVRSQSRAEVESWALAHTGRYPGHLEFTGSMPVVFRVAPASVPDAEPAPATVTALPVAMVCIVCGSPTEVEEVATVPRSSGPDRRLLACAGHADEVSTRALRELEAVEDELGMSRG
ncbi:DUF7848 domain-containing protein [Streptomyces sp. NPDC003691]